MSKKILLGDLGLLLYNAVLFFISRFLYYNKILYFVRMIIIISKSGSDFQ